MDGAGEDDRGYIRSRGLRIPKDARFIAGRTRRNLRADAYEKRESDAVLRVVRPGDRVLELGAGIGYMSALIATRTKAAHVTSFEANPALIPFIAEVHRANDVTNTTVHNALLAPEAGPARRFHIREDFLASSLDPDAAGGVTGTEEVEVRALPAVLEEVRPDVLVCDIEGAEAELLPAGDWTGLRAAVIELHPQWIGQAGVQAVFDAMQRAGLTYFPRASQAKVVTFRKGC
ncbi:FkbM family methyltransferase [Rhodosalinus halophilus]|uniref:FkbM family methyltransferase n=1 Tax=Rhodosalinus halophilus TaxID=2259333 RepID=A0A365U591_9RHOB|nr:FkbM family methyltransferase [Rhodosalinus halophilus]RBI83381.1 FkbM family methyltransferase [Rhodosalinus halophilus]